jgi:hypothetical protein
MFTVVAINRVNYYDIEKYIQWKQHPSITLIKAIKYSGAEFYFNENNSAN